MKYTINAPMRLSPRQIGVLELLREHAIDCADQHNILSECDDRWLTTRGLFFDAVPRSFAHEFGLDGSYKTTLVSLVRRKLITERNLLHYLTIDGVKTVGGVGDIGLR